MNRSALTSLRQYGKVGVQTEVESASPHRLIQMLMEGALARIAAAKGHMARGEVAQKGEKIGMAISIVEGLRASLDHQAGGEVAANLDRLYDYLARRLLEANAGNDTAMLDEVSGLLMMVKEGWDGIPDQLDPADKAAERLSGPGGGA